MKTKTYKKCKGQNRAYGWPGCGKEVIAKTRQYGLCRSCLKEWMVSTPEGEEYIAKLATKGKRKVQQQQRKKKREEQIKKRDYKMKLQDRINEIIRLIDIGLPCLARRIHPSQMHAGHVFSRGAEKPMRYNLHNIHRQSAQSNHHGNDDGLLREGLQQEYGSSYMEFISRLRRTQPLKYTDMEYKEFYDKANKIARELRRSGLRYDKQERIILRDVINLELGIYPQELCQYHGLQNLTKKNL